MINLPGGIEPGRGPTVTGWRHPGRMLLPASCPVCGSPGAAPCARCRASIRRPPLAAPPPGVTACPAVMAYEGAGREIVARLKYRNARCVIPWLAAEMARLVEGPGDPAMGAPADVVTWAPTTGARRRERGFDQGRLLAAAVARRLGVPCLGLLRRERGPAQTGRSRRQRLEGPCYEVRSGRLVPPRVLLVDDVVTTGATLAAAARRLRDAGAEEVTALVAARRP